MNRTTASNPMSSSSQKILSDCFKRPLHDLRISVIDRCNFRCNYCMPVEKDEKKYLFLNQQEWLSFAEIERLVKIFVSLGVIKIRLTGGEPLLRPHLTDLIKNLARIPDIEDLALTTNGALLEELAFPLKEAGLKRLTVSLDTLDENIFKEMNGGKGSVQKVLQGITAAQRAGFLRIKINTVVQKGINEKTLLDLVRYFKGSGHILRFIEYMDVGNQNNWRRDSVVPSRAIIEMIGREFPLRALEPNHEGEVALRYQFADGTGEVGFISSVSEPFCGTCNRARLTTDGKLYTCLFADSGADLRSPLRKGATDEHIIGMIQDIWCKRKDRYSELRAKLDHQSSHRRKVEMFQVGG